MRYAALMLLLSITWSGAEAVGGERTAAKETALLATEVQGKILNRSDNEVRVQARGCWLHIEFGSHNVVFDLPLQGTRAVETEMEDGLVLQNRHMTRTIAGRAPEVFERLILKFGRHNSGQMLDSFENAIKACSEGHAASVSARNSRT